MSRFMCVAVLLGSTVTISATALPTGIEDLKAQAKVCERIAGSIDDLSDIIASYATSAYDRIVLTGRCEFYLQGALDTDSLLDGSPRESIDSNKDFLEATKVCRKALQSGSDVVTDYLLTKRDWPPERQVGLAADCFMYSSGSLFEMKKRDK